MGRRDFLLDVDPETPLEAGDRLVVCGEPKTVARADDRRRRRGGAAPALGRLAAPLGPHRLAHPRRD